MCLYLKMHYKVIILMTLRTIFIIWNDILWLYDKCLQKKNINCKTKYNFKDFFSLKLLKNTITFLSFNLKQKYF